MAILCVSCRPPADLEVRLRALEPDPFTGVELLKMYSFGPNGLSILTTTRWDQGAIVLERPIPPETQILLVEGLDDSGQVFASGRTPILRLAGQQSLAIDVDFSQVGVLSPLPSSPAAAANPMALSTPNGALLWGFQEPGGCVSAETLRVRPGVDASAGPELFAGWSGGQLLRSQDDIWWLGAKQRCSGPEARAVRLLGPEGFDAVTGYPFSPAEGAALASTSDLLVAAGAAGRPLYSPEVKGLNLRTQRQDILGALQSPRAFAQAVSVSEDRLLVVGGRSSATSSVGTATAELFVPRSGSSQGLIALHGRSQPGPELSGALLKTRASNVLWMGGGPEVENLVVGKSSDFPLGEAAILHQAEGDLGAVKGLDLGDGSYLILPQQGGPLHWFQPPRSLLSVANDGAGSRWAGAALGDGTAVLLDDLGQLYRFNPGAEDLFALYEHARSPKGLHFRRPQAWQYSPEGWTGRHQPQVGGRLEPTEWALFAGARFADFDWTFSILLKGRAKAAMIFGYQEQSFDQVVLHGSSQVLRAASSQAYDCAAVPTPEFNQQQSLRVRVIRSGARVRVDVGDDGSFELDCLGGSAPEGFLGMGIIDGEIRFRTERLLGRLLEKGA